MTVQFTQPTAEEARKVVARGIAQRWTADSVVRELKDAG